MECSVSNGDVAHDFHCEAWIFVSSCAFFHQREILGQVVMRNENNQEGNASRVVPACCCCCCQQISSFQRVHWDCTSRSRSLDVSINLRVNLSWCPVPLRWSRSSWIWSLCGCSQSPMCYHPLLPSVFRSGSMFCFLCFIYFVIHFIIKFEID